jgi:REP element-mobilizing transposase RayT
MTLFRNKYRIEPARLPDWDYSKSGFYFITICAFKHVCTFGEIIEREMQVNEYGIILRQEWEKSFEIRCELKRDEFCIMPNHFHAVVRIADVGHRGQAGDARPCVSTGNPEHGVAYRAPQSVSSFIAGFKSTVTIRINDRRKTPRMPVWQPRFYDHVIRDNRELFAIRHYIKSNPLNWENDRDVIETKDNNTGKQPWFVFLPR